MSHKSLQDLLDSVTQQHHDPAQMFAHAASIGTFLVTFMGLLPAVLALIPATYYLILIYESKTIQRFVRRRRMRHRLARMHKRKKSRPS